MISHAPTLGFLQALLGQRVVCFSFGYDRSEVGTPGLSLHAGAKPFGARVSQSHYQKRSGRAGAEEQDGGQRSLAINVL